MRVFFQNVSRRVRTFTALIAFAVLFVIQELFGDFVLRVVYGAAAHFKMTPTDALRFALANPLVSFFGSATLVLIGIFLLAWRDVRRVPASAPPEPAKVDPPKVQAQPSKSAPVTNVRSILSPIMNVEKLADGLRLRAIRSDSADFVDAHSRLPPHRYHAVCASFRNDSHAGRVVVPATDVRARINVGHDVYQVTGHWLLSQYDVVDLLVDAGARDLVVAVRDSVGTILLVDDRRGSGGLVEYPILHTKGITTQNYPMGVVLSSRGVVIGEFDYVLTVTPFELKPVKRPPVALATT